MGRHILLVHKIIVLFLPIVHTESDDILATSAYEYVVDLRHVVITQILPIEPPDSLDPSPSKLLGLRSTIVDGPICVLGRCLLLLFLLALLLLSFLGTGATAPSRGPFLLLLFLFLGGLLFLDDREEADVLCDVDEVGL